MRTKEYIHMSLTRQIAYNTFIQSIGRVLSALIGFGVIVACTRYLGREGFGEYTTVMAFCGFFATVAGMGISLVVTNEVGKKGVNLGRFLSNAFSLRVSTAALILGLGVIVGLFMPYSLEIKQAILVGCFSFFLLSFRHVFDGLFFRELKTGQLVISEILGRGLTLGLVFLSILWEKGLLSILWAVAWGNLLQSGLTYLFSRQYAQIRFAKDFQVWKYILSRSWPLALSVALNLVYFKLDTIILSLLKPQSDVGIYGAAYKILELLIAFPALFCGLILPQLAAMRDTDPARFRRIFQKAFDALLIFTIPLFISIFFFAPSIINFVSGSEFAPSVRVLQILSLAVGITFISALPAHLVVALDQQKKMIWGYLAGAIFSVVVNLILIPRYSYIGAAITTILVEILMLTWSFIVVRKAYFLPLGRGIFWRGIIAGAFLALCLSLLPSSLYFIWRFTLGIILYFLVLYLIGGIRKDLLRELITFKNSKLKM